MYLSGPGSCEGAGPFILLLEDGVAMYPAIVAWLKAGPLPWLALLVPRPGLLYGVVLLMGGFIFVRRARKAGIADDHGLEALLCIAVGALVGTRLFYLVTRTRFWEMSLPQLIDALRKQKADDILVVVGGVIPAQDYAQLKKVGVAAIFGPGTNIPDAARSVLKLIRARRLDHAAE